MTEQKLVAVDEGDPIALITPQELQAQIMVETAKRKILKDYIAKHLKRGVDYGKIHVASKDRCSEGNQCGHQYHWSKDVLFKPGGEKFCSLFRLRGEFTRDQESWEMLGSIPGLVCYLCRLYTVRGVLVGEGKGAASVSEKGNPNTAVKIAKKRAMLDAVLTTGGLSDFFTQDLEDAPEVDALPKPIFAPAKVVPKNAKKLEQKIAEYGKQLGIRVRSPKEWAEVVLDKTSLEFVPENYEEIANRLSVMVKEKNNA